MRPRTCLLLSLLLPSAACARLAQPEQPARSLESVRPEPPAPPVQAVGGAGRLVRLAAPDLDVTLGRIDARADGRLAVDVAKMRAVSRRPGAPVAELRFSYLGPTQGRSALASGELREQLGLKLRAQDGCNLVYVMWRIAPRPGLVVQVKQNAGAHVHAECGTEGYRTVRPLRSSPVPALKPGEAHTLRAELAGEQLRVHVDGRPVWEGALGPQVLAFDGPVGLRSDNARFTLELLAAEPPASAGGAAGRREDPGPRTP